MSIFSGQGPEMSREKFYKVLALLIAAGALCGLGVACLIRGVMQAVTRQQHQALRQMIAKPHKR